MTQSNTRQSAEFLSVKEFQKAFDHPVSEKPHPLTKERVYDRSKWTVEEVIETIYATSEDNDDFMEQMSKMSQDVMHMAQETIDKNNGDNPPQSELDKIVGQVDGLVDALYFVNGSFVELGVNPAPIFDIVQQANMAKLGEDGKPIIRESDGKIMKPDDWEELHAPEPKIYKEIKRQMKQ